MQRARNFLADAKTAAVKEKIPVDLILADQALFNQQQREVYNHITHHYDHNIAEPPRLLILGTAGTGKSYVIKCLQQVLHNFCTVLAPTGVAALNISGSTIHSFFHFANTNTMARLRGPALHTLQEKCANIKYFIIDEVSMIGSQLLNAVDQRLRQAFPQNSDSPFGGASVVFLGDFCQLSPVMDAKLYSPHANIPDSIQEHQAYIVITQVFFLTLCVCQAEDNLFRNLLLRLRNGESRMEVYEHLARRVKGNAGNAPEFYQAIHLYPTRQAVRKKKPDMFTAIK